MDDRKLANLESQLGRLRPAAVPQPLCDHIAQQLRDEPLTMGDRVLVLFSSVGSIAACFIVAMVIWQWSAQSAIPHGGTADDLDRMRMTAEYRELLATR